MEFTLVELWSHMGLFARLIVIAMAIIMPLVQMNQLVQ